MFTLFKWGVRGCGCMTIMAAVLFIFVTYLVANYA